MRSFAFCTSPMKRFFPGSTRGSCYEGENPPTYVNNDPNVAMFLVKFESSSMIRFIVSSTDADSTILHDLCRDDETAIF